MSFTSNLQTDHHDESELIEILKSVLNSDCYDDEIQKILAYIGHKIDAQRVFVFEARASKYSLAYEWCAENVSSHKEIMKGQSLYMHGLWNSKFLNGECSFIEEIEALKAQDLSVYPILKSLEISNLVAMPLILKGNVFGLIGANNISDFDREKLEYFLKEFGVLISHLLEKKNIKNSLHHSKNYDMLTGVYNFNAFQNHLIELHPEHQPIGVVCVSIINLKKVNQELGYEAGNIVIKNAANVLKDSFPEYDIHRVSVGKFVIFCPGISESDLKIRIKQLEEYYNYNHLNVICGSAWNSSYSSSMREVLKLAQEDLSNNKAIYYKYINPKNGSSLDRRKTRTEVFLSDMHSSVELKSFLEKNYFDLSLFLNSLATTDFYPYFGDLQTNNFYITDRMRDMFHFEANVIENFLEKWTSRIPHQEDLELFNLDFKNLYENKSEIHDLRYRVQDRYGKKFWIRCVGILKWDREKNQPLFLSGAVSKLQYDFTIDPITNLPREDGAIIKIQELKYSPDEMTFIGFRLKHFKEINELKGREVANSLIEDISIKISQGFEGKMQLFRLEGLKFLAVIMPEFSDNIDEFTSIMGKEINKLYTEYGVSVRDTCYFAVIRKSQKDISPYDIITNISNLLDVAKDTSNVKYVLHSSEDIHTHRSRNQMIMALNHDVLNNFENFRVVIQPVVDAANYQITSGELLLRWKFNDQDIAPSKFIPLLESNNHILEIGRWVFLQAVIHSKIISSTGNENFKVNFNVSYKQILDDEFPAYMKETLNTWEVDGGNLVMEITESHYNEDPKKLYEFIKCCRDMNMKIALDDFGVGYSSLELLLKYPSDLIKLDRSLIREMTHSNDNKEFIKSIVYSCHTFGKKICVEGVETQRELHAALEAGCDFIQGYYFHKPMEFADFYRLIMDV